MALKDSILGVRPKLEPYEVGEWNQTLYLRRMTHGERKAIGNAVNALNGASEADKNSLLNRMLIASCLCDGDGKRVFDNEDLARLDELDAVVLDRICAQIVKLNRIGADDVEELAKNFESGRS